MRKLKLIEGNLITERSLINLSTYLVRLQALHLEEDVEEGSDISITAMESISKLVNLEELSIKGFVNTMVDRVLILIANRCTKIKELGLSGNFLRYFFQIKHTSFQKREVYFDNIMKTGFYDKSSISKKICRKNSGTKSDNS